MLCLEVVTRGDKTCDIVLKMCIIKCLQDYNTSSYDQLLQIHTQNKPDAW